MASGAGGQRWVSYRDATVSLAREQVAKIGQESVDLALAARGLPKQTGTEESLVAKRARLLASLLGHAAYSGGAAVATAPMGALSRAQEALPRQLQHTVRRMQDARGVLPEAMQQRRPATTQQQVQMVRLHSLASADQTRMLRCAENPLAWLTLYFPRLLLYSTLHCTR